MESNLFDRLDDLTGPTAEEPLWAPRAPYAAHADRDLLLIPLVSGWRDDPAARDALTAITDSPFVDSAVATGRHVELRLSDTWLRATAERLLVEAGTGPRHADLAAGQRTAVYFWGANTTKALHVGHLRNLAVGHALSAALTEAGAEVERRSLLSDIGRGMGEAMAGIMYSGKHGQVLHEIPGKSDHFVGNCYAAYIKSRAQAQDIEDSLDRESVMHEDSADVIVGGVLAGDPHVLELWSKTRAWVLAGHRKTLARLGIEFDRVIFESDFLDEMSEIGQAGIEAGALEKRDDGVVIYRTERSELEEMPLIRPDGLSTQHMRALAYWTVAPELEEMTSIQVCGGEWVSHVTCRQDLMERLSATSVAEQHPTHTVFHGLVAEGGKRLSSSQEGASLIDELIETIDAEIERDPAKRAVRDRLPVPECLGAQVALGYFLLQQTGKAVDFDPAVLLEDGQSLAWDLARARVHPVGPATADDPLDDPAYRFAIVQSELLRVHLRSAIRKLDVTPVARHASHLARWFVEQPRSPEVAAIVRVALDDVERSLGLSIGS